MVAVVTVSDTPHPPAAAYEHVATILGPTYFAEAPPDIGIECTIVGTDGISTTWALPIEMVAWFRHHVFAHPQLRWAGVRPYAPKMPRENPT